MKRLLTLCLAFALLSGCTGPSAQAAERTFFAMDTVMSVRIYGDKALLDAA